MKSIDVLSAIFAHEIRNLESRRVEHDTSGIIEAPTIRARDDVVLCKFRCDRVGWPARGNRVIDMIARRG